jgi:hypothetical protein
MNFFRLVPVVNIMILAEYITVALVFFSAKLAIGAFIKMMGALWSIWAVTSVVNMNGNMNTK